jgi:autotransporter-associated beta strand protein
MEITGGAANFSVTTTGGNPANINGGDSSGPLTITGGTVNLGSAYIGRLSGMVINGGGAVVTATNLNVTSNAGPASHNAPLALQAGSLTIGTSASTGAFVMGTTSGDGTNLLTMSGGMLTYAGTDGLQLGSYTLVNMSGGTASLSGITVDSATGGNGSSELNVTGGTLYLGGVGLVVNSPSASDYAQFGTATVGANTNWSSTAPVTLAGTTTFQAADASSVAHNIALNGTLSGTGNLVKTGGGTLTLSGTNTYAGTTTISGGLLLVTNTARSATGVGAVTVQGGGTLGGNGIVSSAVTVNSGGALAPGNPLGTLTISNNLTLSVGSTTFMQIQHSPLTNNTVKVTGTVTEGGTLNVTNMSVAAFANGDSFKLFNAAGYTGAFANVVLPSLPVGLAWNTNSLNISGTLSVVVAAKPVIGSISVSANGLVFNGTGGVGGANFYLLGATNLAVPLTNWTVLLTNQFDNGGNFNFSNPFSPNTQNFYLLQLQ